MLRISTPICQKFWFQTNKRVVPNKAMWAGIFFWINRCVDTAIRATRVALELQVWHIPKFYSLKLQYFSSIGEYNILSLLIDLMIKKIWNSSFSVDLGF